MSSPTVVRSKLVAAVTALSLGGGACAVAANESAFVNRVWAVAESPTVATGQLYVFLSEGTLIVAAPTGKPALGKWRFDNGKLTMTEEGIERRADIVASSDTELRLRIHDPGDGVELRLVPATRERPAESILGTAWKLESFGTEPLPAGGAPTLEFPEAGRIAGRGSCNSYFGSVEITGNRLRIGEIGATRMACPDTVMEQEARYFAALENAERFERDGETLLVSCAGASAPLRFRATSPAP